MASQTINKLDVACRQLDTAIQLWFNDGDAVSIHTLVFSAHQIVHDIKLHKGGRELLYDSLIIKDEYRREAINQLKKHYNFFKHAERDPSKTIEFDPIITEGFIFLTSLGLAILGRSPNEVREAFNIYFYLSNPHFLNDKGKAEFIETIPEETRNYILRMPRHKFFEEFTRLREKNVPLGCRTIHFRRPK